MPNFAVEIENLDGLVAALKKYPKIAEKRVQQAIEASAAAVQKNAVKGVVPWRTGMLCLSFGRGLTIGRLFARVAPTVEYAIYVHEGTKPKSADHPGRKPNRFMPRILEKASNEIKSNFQRALDLVANDLTK